MKFIKKWRFLIIKQIGKFLIKHCLINDYWVRISDISFSKKNFLMKTSGFKDQIACSILKFGWRGYEQPTGQIVSGLVKNLSLNFIDIGANTGFYSLLASASGAIKVVAYEPVPSIFAILKENVMASGLDVIPRQEALAEEQKTTSIYLPKSDNKYVETSASLNIDFRDQHNQSVEILATSLDFLIEEFLCWRNAASCLIKVDVESYELPVIQGGINFLRKIKPIILIELLDENLDRRKVYDLICQSGYIAFSLSRNQIKKVANMDYQSASHNYLFVPNDYVNSICEILEDKMDFLVSR